MDILLGSLPFLAFVGFIFLRSVKPKELYLRWSVYGMFTLGSVLFDAKNRKLIINGKTIDLTGTETRVLLIFALSPNEL
jgi:DNA-binding response OmpR family regulator